MEYISKDNLFVYYQNLRLHGLDPQSFEVLSGHNGSVFGIFRDKNGVYALEVAIEGGYAGGRKIEGADSETFKVLDTYFERDATSVFSGSTVVPNADTATFTSLAFGYGKDSNSVYFGTTKVEGVDPEHAVIIAAGTQGMDHVLIDGKAVYDGVTKIEGADSESFRLLTYGYAIDKTHLYRLRLSGSDDYTHIAVLFPPFDPSSFQVLNGNYAKDKKTVYYHVERSGQPSAPGPVAANFPDKYFLFGSWHVIPNADTETFTLLLRDGIDLDHNDTPSYASDKNHVYNNGVVVPKESPQSLNLIPYAQLSSDPVMPEIKI